jgi:hypothetical protein
MAPRRRALRDYDDARPLVALARAAVQEATETIDQARRGLEHHHQTTADCRIVDADRNQRQAEYD